MLPRLAFVVLLIAPFASGTAALSQDQPATLPKLDFHLTARPWLPLNTPRDKYLDALEGVCRFTATCQDAHGAVVDPMLHREHQYSTPYFAFGVGTLVHAGRAPDLLEAGIRAMDHATECFAKGAAGIPDHHGEFFLASLPSALALYEGHVPAASIAAWRERLRIPVELIVQGGDNNWRTYAMRGQFLRASLGLADPTESLAFIDNAWLHASQQDRMLHDKWNLYEDRKTDPDSHAVEAVGRVNLLGLVASGYDGPWKQQLTELTERGTLASLLLADPSGQCPPGGRTADHVFNDVLYQLAFEIMAQRSHCAGHEQLAGQYRHAALLSFQSISRWQQTEAPWVGSYFITKNHFAPDQRVGYQPASNYANYNGAVMQHLAEAYLARNSEIVEEPSPAEIGGYALATDSKFASVVANAGGMQIFAALRGDTEVKYDRYWTTLGVVRMGRVHWDTRLGPSDGVRDATAGQGVSFAPTWKENERWVRVADVPDRYRGEFSTQFVHPLLVRCAIDYHPRKGPGPRFRHEFLITPDGVLATLKSQDAQNFGVTWPLLENDGRALQVSLDHQIATTAFKEDGDQQCFLAINSREPLVKEDLRLQSSYGFLRPVRALATNRVQQTFIYPRSPVDMPAHQLAEQFRVTAEGFESPLASVHGNLYIGRTAAGGEGAEIDLTGGGQPAAVFSAPCKFVLQLRSGKIIAVEADRAVSVTIGEQRLVLKPFSPRAVKDG